MMKTQHVLLGLTAALALGLAYTASADEPAQKATSSERVFELRIYTTHPGRLDALNKRFREHTNRLFEKHGMELVGYWTPASGPESENTLIYILAYPSDQAREKAWQGFRNDPEWTKARDESERDGKIVLKVESKMLAPTDYSPIR
jgi:hypothetical protein